MKELPEDLSLLFTELQLYDQYNFTLENFPQVYYAINKPITLDCFCNECGRDSVFTSTESGIEESNSWASDLSIFRNKGALIVKFICSRDVQHNIWFQFIILSNSIMKIGKFPSVADFSSTEIKKYQKFLGKERYRELSKAIGLVSHGIGIGSFVYLRRIFENLIEDAHQQAQLEVD